MILLYVEVKCISPDTHRSYAHQLMLLTGAASCVTPAPVNARVPANIQTGTFPLAGSHIYSTGKIAGLNKGAVRVQISPTKLICNTHGLQKGY